MLYLEKIPRKHISVGILGGSMLLDTELEAKKLVFARSQLCVSDLAIPELCNVLC